MTAIYIIVALSFALCGFSLGMMFSLCRVAAIADKVMAEALRLQRERGDAL